MCVPLCRPTDGDSAAADDCFTVHCHIKMSFLCFCSNQLRGATFDIFLDKRGRIIFSIADCKRCANHIGNRKFITFSKSAKCDYLQIRTPFASFLFQNRSHSHITCQTALSLHILSCSNSIFFLNNGFPVSPVIFSAKMDRQFLQRRGKGKHTNRPAVSNM